LGVHSPGIGAGDGRQGALAPPKFDRKFSGKHHVIFGQWKKEEQAPFIF